MLKTVIKYIKKKGSNFSFYDIQNDLKLTEGQLEIIKLQLLHLGYIKELVHHEGEDELNPITCRICPKSSSCDEKTHLGIKIYQVTPKLLEYED
jgi:hypothetical protein